MDKELYKKLVEIITGYYPISDVDNNQIMEIVANKINHLEAPSTFKSLCKDLERLNHVVEDFSYLQFPNLKLYLEHIEDVGPYRTYKNFAVSISLLAPYYTYFYEYDFRIKTRNGFFPISKVCFLEDEKFALILRKIDLRSVEAVIKDRFPEYSYVSHYPLLVNQVDYGKPFGEFVGDKNGYSIFRYLFDATTFSQEFP